MSGTSETATAQESQYRVKLRKKPGDDYVYSEATVSASTSTVAEDKAEDDEWEAYDSSPLCVFCEPSPHGTNDADYHIHVNLAGPDERSGLVWCCHMHFEALEEAMS